MAEIAASLAKRHGVGEGDEDEKRGDAEEKEDAAQGEDKMEEDEAGEGEVVKKGNVRKRRQIAEEDYFDADDDEEEEEAAKKGDDGAGDGGDEEEEDPLDAFMKGVTKEVKKLDKADEKRAVQTVDMDSILKTNKALAAGKKMKIKIGALGQRMEQEDGIPDQEELEEVDEFDINEWNDRKNQAKQLRPVRESCPKPEP